MSVVAQETVAPAVRPGVLRRAARRPLGVVSAAFIVLVAAACILAPILAPYGAQTEDLLHVDAGPSAAHLLGTDELGRDVLSRLLYGGRITLLGVLECVVVILVISLPLGLATGYLGGRFDRFGNAAIDLVLSIPAIIVVLAVLAVFGSSMTVGMVTYGIIASAAVSRVVRSATLSVREELYVDAARTSGLSNLRIVVSHVLPRIAGPVIVQTALWAALALIVQTGLAFLGLGVTPPAPSWGGMVAEAAQLIDQDRWLLVPSGGIIALTTLAFGFIGDAVRDAAVEGWSGSAQATRPSRRGAARRAAAVEAREPVPDMAVLAARSLSVSFSNGNQAVTVVDDISFDLRSGEVLGILGESGSGKSVTALTLLGLTPGDGHATGTVHFAGHDLTKLRESELQRLRGGEIAMVFQDPMVALDPSFRVGAQIAEVVRQHRRMSRAEAWRAAVTMLGRVRLRDPETVARRYPHELSGGMAQRVCLALALSTQPRVLIADEPTTALDVTVQAEILDLLRTLRDDHELSIILVTHDWGVVADICDRVVVMYAGQVVEVAEVEQLFREPLHPYSLALQRSNPATADLSKDLPTIPGSVPPPGAWPSSCRFYDRCAHAKPQCARSAISLESVGERAVRCCRWRELAWVEVGV
ncbi:MAG: dipeptide/oligopeptide/nickel ABC transporter permease/ATP-binding protein [Steroidobacteraceae bacterium]